MSTRKVTLRDVAGRAEVSISTVSMVLNNKAQDGNVRISDRTIQKVRQIARDVGYLTHRRQLVGLILTWLRDGTETPMIHSMIEKLRETDGLHLAMGPTTRADIKAEFEQLHMADRQGFDGLIMEPSFALLDQLNLKPGLRSSWKNLVFIHRYPTAGVPCVTIDHRRCGEMAGRHLLKHGHRRIAFLEGHCEAVPLSCEPARERQILQHRLEGFRQALSGDGVECRVFPGVHDLLQQQQDLTAVYCAHPRGSTALLNECWHRGVRMPEELSIVGQDDEPAKQTARPAITTIDVRPAEVGARAAGMVQDLMEGRTPPSVVLQPTVISRDSVARICKPGISGLHSLHTNGG
ncbi:MAG: LacI family DNA-binding transcriptional regulator [bacterium]|nr:LacI family DNA-binding transcriptional regulator [bacterium]